MLLPRGDWGKVFLLTSEEAKDKSIGLGSGEGMKGWATEYAVRATGSFVYSVGKGARQPLLDGRPVHHRRTSRPLHQGRGRAGTYKFRSGE